MSNRTLKIGLYISGILSLFAFVAIRSLPVMNWALVEDRIPGHWEFTQHGELYYFNCIRHFQNEPLPKATQKFRLSNRHPNLEEADIITFGDSFFDFARQTTLPERIQDTLNRPVFYARFDRPLEYLHDKNFNPNRRRLMIYETAERYLNHRFLTPHPYTRIDPRPQWRINLSDFIRLEIFPERSEESYNWLLKGGYLTRNIYSFITTLKFDVFGYISEITPVYKLGKNPWLFYYEQVNQDATSFYYQHSKNEIDAICDNIATLAHAVDSLYNMDFVFMPIPNKYTVCHTVLNNDTYNQLLPQIYQGLEARGIPVIKLYDDFMTAGHGIYFHTDTHWNKKGIDIGVNRLIEALPSRYTAALNSGAFTYHSEK